MTDAPSPPPSPEAESPGFVWQLLGQDKGSHPSVYNPDYIPGALLNMSGRPARRILDIGCSAGAAAAALKAANPGSLAFGVEPTAQMADIARTRLDGVFNGIFEEFDPDKAGFELKDIDTVILGDVLEHMYNPWQTLVDLHKVLTDDAQLLICIPNVRNITLLEQAARGRWKYESMGLLDVTHIRFFTMREMIYALTETGYKVSQVSVNPDTRLVDLLQDPPKIGETKTLEYGCLSIKDLSPSDYLECLVLQFLFRAERA